MFFIYLLTHNFYFFNTIIYLKILYIKFFDKKISYMQCNTCQIARIFWISSQNNFLSAKSNKFWISSTLRCGDDLTLHVPVYGEPLMSLSNGISWYCRLRRLTCIFYSLLDSGMSKLGGGSSKHAVQIDSPGNNRRRREGTSTVSPWRWKAMSYLPAFLGLKNNISVAITWERIDPSAMVYRIFCDLDGKASLLCGLHLSEIFHRYGNLYIVTYLYLLQRKGSWCSCADKNTSPFFARTV